jgi:type IV pilus assembly protein PilA
VERRGFTLIELIIVVAIIAVIAAIAIPGLVAARKSANEGAALGAVKTLANCQHIFRESDKDGDNNPDFGSLAELSNASMVDGILGSGKKAGYLFDTNQGSKEPTALYFIVASPESPLSSGDRYFCSNQRGGIYYTSLAVIPPNYVDCSLPSNVLVIYH